MSGAVLASVIWHRLDRDGTDRCRLSRVGDGWMLLGHARWEEPEGEVALDYALRVDDCWRCTGADVTGFRGPAPVAWRITRRGGGWALEGQAPVDGEDLDLGFTPAWMVVPLRRLSLPEARPVTLSTAALGGLGAARLEPREHSFCRQRDGLDHAVPSLSRDARLNVDPGGFVTEDPGRWRGVMVSGG